MPDFTATEADAAQAALRATTLHGLFTAVHALTHRMHNSDGSDVGYEKREELRVQRDLVEAEIERRVREGDHDDPALPDYATVVLTGDAPLGCRSGQLMVQLHGDVSTVAWRPHAGATWGAPSELTVAP